MRRRLTEDELIEILESPAFDPDAGFKDDLHDRLRERLGTSMPAAGLQPTLFRRRVLTFSTAGAFLVIIVIAMLMVARSQSNDGNIAESEPDQDATRSAMEVSAPNLVEVGEFQIDAVCRPAETLAESEPEETEPEEQLPAFWTAQAISPDTVDDIEPLATLIGARWVNSLSFNSDSSLLIAGDASSAIHVWDVPLATRIATVSLHLSGDVTFLPDSDTFASADCAGVNLWNVNTFEQTGTPLTTTTHYRSIDLSPETGWIAANSAAESQRRDNVKVWDPASNSVVLALETESTTLTVAISPDGTRLATGHFNGTVTLWYVSDGTKVNSIVAHNGPVTNLAFSPDGRYLASSGGDSSVIIWDGLLEEMVYDLEDHHDWIEGLEWTPDGLILASSSRDGNVHLWSIETGQSVHQISLPVRWDTGTPSATSIAFSPDGRLLAIGSSLGVVRLYGIPEQYTIR